MDSIQFASRSPARRVASLDVDGVDFRAMMSDYWTSQWKNVKFPKKGSASTVFDYYLDPKTC